MKSNYKRIGEYIRLVDGINSDLKTETLLGLTINKDFIPSVANTVGSDMSRYKIIRENQFACSLMQVRRDKKIPVALQRNYKEAIISQAYPVFEVTNKDELLPEYLMMWFSRSEFDREACFYAVGGVRGSLEWEDFCNMQLPVPDIEKQKAIVKEYNTIVNRIKLNEQLNQKLEETAQAIYKEWFVEFEFPMTKEYAEAIGKPELEGKAYKANGGKMVWNEVLGKEIPMGWSDGTTQNFGKVVTGKTPSSNNPKQFGNNMSFVTPTDFKDYGKFVNGAKRRISQIGIEAFSSKILKEGSLLVTCIGSDMGKVVINKNNCLTNQQINSIIPFDYFSIDFLYYYFKSIYTELRNMATGSSTMLMINKTDFELISILKPNEKIIQEFYNIVEPIDDKLWNNSNLSIILCKMKDMFLSKMTKA